MPQNTEEQSGRLVVHNPYNNSNPGPPPVLSQVMVCLLSRDHGEVEVAARRRVLCHPR